MSNFKTRQPDLKLIYKSVNGINLPMWVYFPDENIKNASAVFLIHGGGWRDAICDNSEWNGGWMRVNACRLAETGYISVIISYRSLNLSDKLNVSELFADCCDAVRYIREHLKFINFDTFACIGESAGGYFSTMLGLSADDNLRPKKTVSINPVLGDLDKKWKYAFNGIDDIEKFSPFNKIGDKASDFLFMHGTNDSVVDIKYTEKLDDLLTKRGFKSQFAEIIGAEHAFSLYDYKSDDDFVNEIMDYIINFIDKTL